MPRVKIARDNNCTNTPKKMATRSRDKMKLEIKKKMSSAVMPKGKRIMQMTKAKSLTSVGQQKQKDIDVRGNKENKKRANASGNINKDGFIDYNKTVKQNTKQKGMVIYIYDDNEDSDDDDDDGKDSKDDNDSNSTDDYEPDTEDEEEYRSRSFYW